MLFFIPFDRILFRLIWIKVNNSLKRKRYANRNAMFCFSNKNTVQWTEKKNAENIQISKMENIMKTPGFIFCFAYVER